MVFPAIVQNSIIPTQKLAENRAEQCFKNPYNGQIYMVTYLADINCDILRIAKFGAASSLLACRIRSMYIGCICQELRVYSKVRQVLLS